MTLILTFFHSSALFSFPSISTNTQFLSYFFCHPYFFFDRFTPLHLLFSSDVSSNVNEYKEKTTFSLHCSHTKWQICVQKWWHFKGLLRSQCQPLSSVWIGETESFKRCWHMTVSLSASQVLPKNLATIWGSQLHVTSRSGLNKVVVMLTCFSYSLFIQVQ